MTGKISVQEEREKDQ